MGLLRALAREMLAPHPAKQMQQALDQQKRLDMFDITCRSCDGFGIVDDLSNRWWQCPGMCGSQEGGCPQCEMVNGSKRCPECDGLGSPRG